MTATTDSSFVDLLEEERERQRGLFGDDHPNRYSPTEWSELLGQNQKRLAEYAAEAERTGYTDKVRLVMVQTAATCMAAHEALGRRAGDEMQRAREELGHLRGEPV